MHQRPPATAVAVFVLVLCVVGLLAYGVIEKQPDNSLDEAILAGKREPAPQISLPELFSAKPVRISDYRGKVVVFNVWASWCGPCRDEAPALERAYRKYKHRGVVVLGADADDTTQKARAFIERFNLTYPMVRYSTAQARKDFNATGLPETFAIDRSGRIAKLVRGQVGDRWLNEVLPELIEEPPTTVAGG